MKSAEMVRKARAVPGYWPMPILFNQDEHFDLERTASNFVAGLGVYRGRGCLDPGRNNSQEGYPSPPIRWDLNTERKRAFFARLKEIKGE